MTAYQFAKLTGWQQSQISRFRSGAVAWSKPHDFLLDALDFAMKHGFSCQITNKKETKKMSYCDECGEEDDDVVDGFCAECREPIECRGCRHSFSRSEYSGIDDEYDEKKQLCPQCQAKNRLVGQQCEHCDNPAAWGSPDGTFLCEDHAEEYQHGYDFD